MTKKYLAKEIMMTKKIYKIIFISILFLAIFSRILFLNNWPISFNQDEVLNGYEAYSILKTGRDHRGNFLPLFFEGFSDRVDNRSPLYIYSTIPSVAILGLNKFAVRLPAVIFGILTVLLTYFLAKEFFKKESIALLASFFLAISPWHIFLSRVSFEAITVPFFTSLTILFILKGFKKPKFIIFSTIPLALNFYTYAVTKVFTPLSLLGFLIIYWKKIWGLRKYIILAFFLFLIIALPFLYTQLTEWHKIQGRFNQVSIFNFYFWPLLLFFNYLIYFHPKFLLTHYLIPVIMAAFVGLNFLWQKRERKKFQILFWLIVTSLLPTALTVPIPHSLRAITLLPFIEIIAAYGFYKIYFVFKEKIKIKPKKIMIVLSSIFILLFLFNLDFLLKIGYPYNFDRGFYQFGFKEIIAYIKENQDKYENIVFTDKANQPYIYFLFHLKYPPEKFQSLKAEREYFPDGWQRVVSFDKYRFCDLNKCYKPNENNLYIARANEIPQLKEKKIFHNLDGSVFRIITND